MAVVTEAGPGSCTTRSVCMFKHSNFLFNHCAQDSLMIFRKYSRDNIRWCCRCHKYIYLNTV